MSQLAAWSVRHKLWVVLMWVAILGSVTVSSQLVGSVYTSNLSLPTTQSSKAAALLNSVRAIPTGDTEQIVVSTRDGLSVYNPGIRHALQSILSNISTLKYVQSVVSPYSTGNASMISPGGGVAVADVHFSKSSDHISSTESAKLISLVSSGDSKVVNFGVVGALAANAVQPSVGGIEPGVVLAALVLLVVFGSLFAMILPIISALASLGSAVGVIALLSHVFQMPDFSINVVVLVGLGVGIDYALFIVTRHRQGLMAGRGVEDSIVVALDTSGRAVLFAGVIVCVALMGMFAMGVSFLYGLAVATSVGVALTMLAALTLLPAVMGFLGMRVLSRRQRKALGASSSPLVGPASKGFWWKWSSLVSHRPIWPVIAAGLLVTLMIVPFFGIRLGSSDQGNDPAGSAARVAYDNLVKGFGPGYDGPLLLVTQTPSPPSGSTLGLVENKVRATFDVRAVTVSETRRAGAGRFVTFWQVTPDSGPESAQTVALIKELRATVLPAVAATTGVDVVVGGETATVADFAQVMSARLPWLVGAVVLLSFLLLLLVFRSVLVPALSAGMNLLSIGAACGILVAVFQHGWLGGLFGVDSRGPLETFLPVLLFSVLFGLSMDYQVFLITRIHEEWLRCSNNREAVRNGLAATGRTITAAALIMILVFGSFLLTDDRIIKEFGLGLAAGVLVDAIIIRMTFVPALMNLFGRANWWFPARLGARLPGFDLGEAEDLEDLEDLEALEDLEDLEALSVSTDCAADQASLDDGPSVTVHIVRSG